ncbi:MAG TPA: glycoside hydrolase family 88 protein [Bacteroidales bacterium]|nr:glycoside hydrolase family 88 protein [Bacteroidales bacterium]
MPSVKYLLLLPLITLVLVGCKSADAGFKTDKALQYCAAQVNRTLTSLKPMDYSMMPRNIAPDSSVWSCRKVDKSEWCSGFWPGILWYDFENTNDSIILKEAKNYTSSLTFLSKTPAYDHDLGFLLMNSAGNAYRLTADTTYKKVLLDAAETLATLYNPKVGTLLSWPREVSNNGWPHNTIMDNMINLELLFWAAANGDDHRLYDIAVSHANKTMQYQFRKDYSSYHVAVYDTLDGHFIKCVTHQGYSDESMWARGQAWAIYGFTMVYRETKDTRYLDFVQKVADIYLSRLPADGVPYWDFNDPTIPAAPKDASASAITASALIELSGYVKDKSVADNYRKAAKKMLISLSSEPYRSGSINTAFLLHSTGNKPKENEIDYSIIYADYYYIEALMRLKDMEVR